MREVTLDDICQIKAEAKGILSMANLTVIGNPRITICPFCPHCQVCRPSHSFVYTLSIVVSVWVYKSTVSLSLWYIRNHFLWFSFVFLVCLHCRVLCTVYLWCIVELPKNIPILEGDPYFTVKLQDYTAVEKDEVVLDCELSKDVDVMWYHNEAEIKASKTVNIKAEGKRRVLIIKRVGDKDKGQYLCDCGTDKTTATLHIEGKDPEISWFWYSVILRQLPSLLDTRLHLHSPCIASYRSLFFAIFYLKHFTFQSAFTVFFSVSLH